MGRVRVFIVLVLAVCAGGVFAFATYNYVQKLPARTTQMPTRPVVVAALDLDIGSEIPNFDSAEYGVGAFVGIFANDVCGIIDIVDIVALSSFQVVGASATI